MDRKTFFFLSALALSFYLINQWLAPAPLGTTQPAPNQVLQQLQQVTTPVVNYDEGELHVLENKYQQLVFSTRGGALAEINLPLKNDLRPIEIDKEFKEYYPALDKFPAKTGSSGGYYPLIRRSLPGKPAVNPLYYTAQTHDSKDGSIPLCKVTTHTKDQIVFECPDSSGKTLKKIYTLPKNPDQEPYIFNLSIEGGLQRVAIGSGIPEVEIISGSAAPFQKFHTSLGGVTKTEQIKLPKAGKGPFSSYAQWVCNSNGFFGIILHPQAAVSEFNSQFIPGNLAPHRSQFLAGGEMQEGYNMEVVANEGTNSIRFFAGPFSESVLKQLDKTYSASNPDYNSCRSFHGWFSFISEPFAKLLFFMMKTFYAFTGSWGFSIILLTFFLRMMLYPLNAWSIKSTNKMQSISPKVAAIQEKYKSDPKKAQIEVMNLYKAEGVNPITGCFPILIQLPFLIGMFDLLKSSFELRGASFIPGWIDNLTAPDVVFRWSGSIPLIGNSLHLLPILLGVAMFFQQRMSAPKNVNEMTDQQRQQRFMGNIMVVVFTFMFYNFPSGLNIYWLSSMLLGIAQQMLTTKNLKKGPGGSLRRIK